MLDIRCYNCADIIQKEEGKQEELVEREYKGNGIFKCPRCTDVLDFSKSTYKTKIVRKRDEEGELCTEILEFDPKLNEEGRYCFETDMIEMDIFEDIAVGTHILEVYWCYYECGGFEGEEWDVEIDILSEEEV